MERIQSPHPFLSFSLMAGGVLQLLFVHEGLGSDEEGASEEERADRLLYAWPGLFGGSAVKEERRMDVERVP